VGMVSGAVEKVYDLAIVGSGPARYTAALYAARAGLDSLVFQGFESGGQPMLTHEVEDYPGYRDGVLGPKMMYDFEAQAASFGAEMRPENVVWVDFSGRPFGLWAGAEEEWTLARAVVATGGRPKSLGVEGDLSLKGRGVSGFAACDAFFFLKEQEGRTRGRGRHGHGGGPRAR
jgi:thioredoxin reductase (NADPH)